MPETNEIKYYYPIYTRIAWSVIFGVFSLLVLYMSSLVLPSILENPIWGILNIFPIVFLFGSFYLAATILFLSSVFSHLKLTPDGIEYRDWCYKIYSNWDDVEQIKYRSVYLQWHHLHEYYLKLRNPKIEAHPIIKLLLKGVAPSSIPLHHFAVSYPSSRLQKEIAYYVQHLRRQ
jgi:hypothetical protein